MLRKVIIQYFVNIGMLLIGQTINSEKKIKTGNNQLYCSSKREIFPLGQREVSLDSLLSTAHAAFMAFSNCWK